MTIISTTSERDLSELNTPLMQFSRELPTVQVESLLHYAHKWFLGSRDGCSCGFRHLDRGNEVLGFSDQVEWWPEEPEDIEATLQVVRAFKDILSEGARLDCIDAWANDDQQVPVLAGNSVINLEKIPETSFRFFEWHRFELKNEP